MEDRNQQNAVTRPVVEARRTRRGRRTTRRTQPRERQVPISAARLPAFLSEMVGHVPHRPRKCHIQREPQRAVTVLPMLLKEVSESGLPGKLEQHQLEHKHGGDLRKRPRPATRRCGQGTRATDRQRDRRGPDGNRQQRNQVPAHRDPQCTLRRARSATPACPANAAVTRKAARPTPRPANQPCSGRPNGKISESTIGGIAAVTKPAPRLIGMNATTGWRATLRRAGDNAFRTRRSQAEEDLDELPRPPAAPEDADCTPSRPGTRIHAATRHRRGQPKSAEPHRRPTSCSH